MNISGCRFSSSIVSVYHELQSRLYILIWILLIAFISGCTSTSEKQKTRRQIIKNESTKKELAQDKVERDKVVGSKLCKNIKNLKKGMTLEDVHNQLGFGDNKKYAFTKPLFYIKCYENDIIITYAQFKFFFNLGCTFRKVYSPEEKEMEDLICSDRGGELGPPEIFKY